MRTVDLPLYYNTIDILERNLPLRRDKIALYSHTRTLTFQHVSTEANQVGNALQGMGVSFGDFVGILAPDSAEWVTSFFGIVKIGAIAVCMNTLLQSHEYDYILRDSRMRVLIVHEDLLPVIIPIRNKHTTLQQVIVIRQSTQQVCAQQAQPVGERSFQAWIANEATTLASATTHRDDFCTLHYTSGTTGEPKGVLHAHKDYPLIAQLSGVNLFGIHENDRTFAAAKLFFVYGLGGNLIFPWYVGAATILHGGPAHQTTGLLETIARFRPTVFSGVPTVYVGMLTMRNLTQKYDLTSLRLCLSAGEALPASVWHKWKTETALEILDTVGCTENLHTFLANRPDDLRPGSSGKPSPGYEVKLVDDEGYPTQSGEIGNLMVKGESIALFYLHQSEKSRYTFRGEWLFTGDKYTVDVDGFYWHAGRNDDMFKVGGLWVSPVEVESVLTSHPAVLECAVVAEADRNDMLKACAFVTLQANAINTTELHAILLHHCRASLPMYKCPWRIEFIPSLPKTATGKIQRYKLRSQGD